MATAIKSVRVQSVTTEVEGAQSSLYASMSDSVLTRQFIAYRDKASKLEEAMEAMKEELKKRLVDGELVTTEGAVKLTVRRTYSWTMESVKSIIGRQWASFVQPDAKLLKARMATADEIGTALAVGAIVKTSEALTVVEPGE